MAVTNVILTAIRIRRAIARGARFPLLPASVIVGFVVVAVIGPYIAPYSPVEGVLSDKLLPPSWSGGQSSHFLGTDALGRDILSRLLAGARVSFMVSVLGIAVAGSIGTALGLLAGYFGGWTSTVIMSAVDIALALPGIMLAFIFALILGPSLTNVVIVIALLLWARYARQVRGEVLSIKERDFVALSRAAGSSHVRIMMRHVLPHLVNTLVVVATLQIGWAIVLESTLSFLGVGLPPPQPAWGLMVADGRGMIASAWWVSLFPGLCILLVCLSMNLFGDWLRDALDPKLRQV